MADTSDFFMAVYLLAIGEEMSALQVQPEEVFQFTDSPTLQERMDAYRTGTALVNPKVFARQIMKLRQQLQERHPTSE
ncbi:MAG: hypothetical protein O7G88_21090 [bacterium]|nr:hypothetical protein [bacterium]